MTQSKQLLIVLSCLSIIFASAISIYLTQRAQPVRNRELHLGVGRVMAQETARILAGKGKVVIIDMSTAKAPELKIQLDEFEKTLTKLGTFTLYRKTLDTEDQAKYRTGAGLSARRFLRVVKNHKEANAIVSFVGAPTLSDDEILQ